MQKYTQMIRRGKTQRRSNTKLLYQQNLAKKAAANLILCESDIQKQDFKYRKTLIFTVEDLKNLIVASCWV